MIPKFNKNISGSFTMLVVLLILGALAAIVILNFDKVNFSTLLDDLYYKAIKTGECRPIFEVKHRPGYVTESELAASNCYDKLNRDDCLEVDVFSSNTGNFLNKDGIIDCEWIKR